VRTDPTDNGGLFVGRRPGTRPVHYRTPPKQGDARRRRRDAVFAGFLLGLMIFVALLFWGPIPVGWLWVVSQVPFFAHHIFFGLSAAFFGILATYMFGLVAMKQLDRLWILARRAAGVDQRDGVIGRVFAYTAIVGATLFSIWLILLGGLADSLKNNSA
jgi:hypothetical protein